MLAGFASNDKDQDLRQSSVRKLGGKKFCETRVITGVFWRAAPIFVVTQLFYVTR